jgi:hypothetical protein
VAALSIDYLVALLLVRQAGRRVHGECIAKRGILSYFVLHETTQSFNNSNNATIEIRQSKSKNDVDRAS